MRRRGSSRLIMRGRRVRLHAKQSSGGIQGGSMRSLGGQRDDLLRTEHKGENGQIGMDATLKRNLARKGRILGKTVSGGTMMADPLESVRLPIFVNGKKKNRNNIKISL